MGEDSLFPESGLRDRIKLAYDWIPERCAWLLDGGCAYGSGTRHFHGKADAIWGEERDEK